MKYFILISFTILVTLLSISCSNKNDRLIVDEIYISKHNFISPFRSTIKYYPPGATIAQNESLEKDTINNFCLKNNLFPNSSYLPILIVKVDNNGRLIGYIKNCQKLVEGYFQFMLSDSLLSYFNNQIEIMNYKKLDTLYSDDLDLLFYNGPEYYLSIKCEGIEKQLIIKQDYKGPKNIVNFIDSLYNRMEKLKLSQSINSSFRRDTMIVFQYEKYFNETSKKFKKL